MKHLYLSFSPRDNRIMAEMRDRLLHQGFKPWIDPEPHPGGDWRFLIDDAIQNSDAVIVIVTPNSVNSDYVTYEWALALGLGVQVIPVIFKKPDNMHPRLMTLNPFSFYGFKDPAHFWDYFLRELKRILSAPPAAPPPVMPENAPPPLPSVSRSVMPDQPGYWLVIRRGPDLNKMIRLENNVITIGRDATNDITINDAEVSRYHTRLRWDNTGFVLEDLNATNGTFVDGRRLHGDTPLHPGQMIMLGDAIILTYEVIT